MKNFHAYFENLAVWTMEDFKNMFGHFSTLYMKGLINLGKFVVAFNAFMTEVHII